ncbi:MAG: anti-sigma F factor [Ruminococcaceae bacterium]|nr:anti-sigma F factor [Oscillospiraceae bacterium]
MKNTQNYFKTILYASSVNEAYSRVIVSAFAAQLDPTVEEIADIKTAVSEAVTNCIVHAYRYETDEKKKKIYIEAFYDDEGNFTVTIKDRGCGIEDIKQAMEPLFTTDAAGERSGMGFAIMESFTDKLKVSSKNGKGTKVTMTKKLNFKKTLSEKSR